MVACATRWSLSNTCRAGSVPSIAHRTGCLRYSQQAGLRNLATQPLARHPQSAALGKLLGRERRTEIRITFTNQRHRKIPTPSLIRLFDADQSPYVGSTRRRRCSCDPTAAAPGASSDQAHAPLRPSLSGRRSLRQNLDPLQIALAHRNQSHPQSPMSAKRGV